jgi:hypothetical protein
MASLWWRVRELAGIELNGREMKKFVECYYRREREMAGTGGR